MVGCREVVDDRATGLLCRLQDAGDLADKMRRMMDMSEAERAAMGGRERKKMVRQFDERIVIGRYLEVGGRWRRRTSVRQAQTLGGKVALQHPVRIPRDSARKSNNEGKAMTKTLDVLRVERSVSTFFQHIGDFF